MNYLYLIPQEMFDEIVEYLPLKDQLSLRLSSRVICWRLPNYRRIKEEIIDNKDYLIEYFIDDLISDNRLTKCARENFRVGEHGYGYFIGKECYIDVCHGMDKDKGQIPRAIKKYPNYRFQDNSITFTHSVKESGYSSLRIIFVNDQWKKEFFLFLFLLFDDWTEIIVRSELLEMMDNKKLRATKEMIERMESFPVDQNSRLLRNYPFVKEQLIETMKSFVLRTYKSEHALRENCLDYAHRGTIPYPYACQREKYSGPRYYPLQDSVVYQPTNYHTKRLIVDENRSTDHYNFNKKLYMDKHDLSGLGSLDSVHLDEMKEELMTLLPIEVNIWFGDDDRMEEWFPPYLFKKMIDFGIIELKKVIIHEASFGSRSI